ncbi:hypothetical protein B0F90DRAFT_991694 [Multifurca ochricompacta]|uniref:Uncharacterized protein n=1 Tax=Multifurca ochricompacta TaxID=376703 RepID=A0AAD4QLP7_9AGAM|nr:hypothetical protein B0F90DRAFT_991694 [Multifurca ochricompacta]
MSTDLSDIELEKWLEGHHHQYEDPLTAEIIHVYAIAGAPVFHNDTKVPRYDFDIEVPLWGITWVLKGYIDVGTFEINAEFSVRTPIITPFRLAAVKGNLKDGVKVSFDVSFVKGEAKFYIFGGWLWVDLSATVFGTTYGPLKVKLIPLPFVD